MCGSRIFIAKGNNTLENNAFQPKLLPIHKEKFKDANLKPYLYVFLRIFENRKIGPNNRLCFCFILWRNQMLSQLYSKILSLKWCVHNNSRIYNLTQKIYKKRKVLIINDIVFWAWNYNIKMALWPSQTWSCYQIQHIVYLFHSLWVLLFQT